MSVLADRDIRALQELHNIIDMFVDYDVERPAGTISYGLTSAGYDVRLAPEFKISTDRYGIFLDPKHPDPRAYEDSVGDSCIIPPNGSMLGRSLEYIKVPRGIVVDCIGKSTYSRCSVIANVTPLEPEWEGQITIEISNGSRCPVRIYANEGILQLQFHPLLGGDCERSYANKKGKYQGQRGIVLPRI